MWGTGIYTDDSYVATAAVHSGVVADGETRTILVAILPGQSYYITSTQYGVTSFTYGPWVGSYQIIQTIA